ncbi:MAG: choice-of-anchor Q domain-containing protein [Pseudomonadota bacterium]
MAQTTAQLSGVAFNELLQSPGAVLTNDFDGDGDVDNGDRFVEFYNTSSVAVDLEGWQLYLNGVTLVHTFDAGDTIPANGFFTLVNSGSGDTEITNVEGEASFTDSNLSYSSGTDSLILFNPDADEFIYLGGIRNGDDEATDIATFRSAASTTATQVGTSEFLPGNDTGNSYVRSSDGDDVWINQPSNPGVANNATIVVNTADDNDDGNISDGSLSLREAIALIADGGTISFDADVFTGGSDSLIQLTLGELEIDKSITIDGSTGTDIVITGDADGDDTANSTTFITDIEASTTAGTLDDNSRVFNITSSSADTTLIGLTLTGGYTGGQGEDGGAIRTSADLTIEDSTISGNGTAGQFADGGGIFGAVGAVLTLTNTTLYSNQTTGFAALGGGVSATSSITLTDSTVQSNSTAGDYSDGGGVHGSGLVRLYGSTVKSNMTSGDYAQGAGVHGSAAVVVADDSTITSNFGTGRYALGGGVYAGGALTVTDSAVSYNATFSYGGQGGGIFGDDTITITSSEVNANSTGNKNAEGGGIYGRSTVTINQSTFDGNETRNDYSAGGAIFANGELTVANSTISDSYTNGTNSYGGGIYGAAGITLVNTTLAANGTLGSNSDGSAVFSQGGGDLTITNATISGNYTSTGNSNGSVFLSNGSAQISNSIIMGNYAPNSVASEVVRDNAAVITFVDANIIGTTIASGGSSVGTTTAVEVFAETFDNNGVDAGVLADNGGPVETIALLFDLSNPALDSGTNSEVPTEDDLGIDVDLDGTIETTTVSVDANGNTRIVDGDGDGTATSDLGASEVQETPSLVVTTAEDVVADDGVTSLREAIAFANSATDADNDGEDVDTVTFDASVFTGGANSLIRLLDGRILITDAVSIDGSTGTNIVITGDAGNDDILVTGTYITDVAASTGYLYENGRIFNITDSDAATTINGLTLTGGYTYSSNIDGGAIRSVADLTLTDTTIRGNGTRGDLSQGGGIFSTGDVTLTGSTVSENLTVGNSSEGGGIFTSGDLTVTNSTISSNATLGVSSDGGGVFSSDFADVVLVNSTVSGNTTAGDNADGGGIKSFGSVTLTNTTVADNAISGDESKGGGIFAYRATSITNSTFTGNTALGTASYGGGLYLQGGYGEGTSLSNSLLLGNLAASGDADIAVGTLYNPTVTYVGGNIVGDTLSTDGTEVTTGITAAEVFDTTQTANGVTSGVLADNGGDVQTVALLASGVNPAVEVGDLPSGLTTDANGNAREVDLSNISNGGTVDAGAVELQLTGAETESLIVTSTDDTIDPFDGLISLREAISFINDGIFDEGSTITFDESLSGSTFYRPTDQGSLTLEVGMTIDGDIDGDGKADITISANSAADTDDGDTRVFIVSGGDTAFSGLTITGGQTIQSARGSGGGIANLGTGELTVTNSTLSDNAVFNHGGGIFSNGAVVLDTVTLANNLAGGYGGGLNSQSAATVINSTFYGNDSFFSGGGAYLSGTATLTNTTFTGNTSASQSNGTITIRYGGVYIEDASDVTLTNSLVVGNRGSQVVGDYTDGGGNLIGSGTISASDVFDTTVTVNNVTAGALADNGGPVETVALLLDASNPALDIGDLPSGVTTDANGNAREFDQPSLDNGGTVDAGAVELQVEPASLIVTTAEDVVDNTDGVTSLREAIAFANSATDADGDGNDVDTVTFDASVFDGETADIVRLTEGEIEITDAVIVDGDLDDDGVADVVISGDAGNDDITDTSGITDVDASLLADETSLDDNSRVLNISSETAETTLNGLIITGGSTTDDASTGDGAGVRTIANLTVTDSVIAGNQVTGLYVDGGAIAVPAAVSGERYVDIYISNTEISGNRATGAGGGVKNTSYGGVTIQDSTITDNTTTGYLASGGGVAAFEGDITITDSIISNNHAIGVARPDTSSTVFIDVEGGGIRTTDGNITISGTEVTGNSATIDGVSISGGGIDVEGGGIRSRLGDVTLINSVVANNEVSATDTVSSTDDKEIEVEGGGIRVDGGGLTLINSTVAGNIAVSSGSSADGGVSVIGGGIRTLESSDVSLISSTVTGNYSSQTGGGVGIEASSNANLTPGGLTLANTLIVGNGAATSGAEVYHPSDVTQTVTGPSIIGTTLYDGAGGSSTLASTVAEVAQSLFDETISFVDLDGDGVEGTDERSLGTDIEGGVLADNGGDVQTIALLASLTNPAIDAGDDTLLVEATVGLDLNGDGDGDDTLSTDARGFTRAVDVDAIANNGSNTVDLGAFETQTEATIGPDILEGTSGADSQDPGAGNDLVLSLDGADFIFLDDGGSDSASTGEGNDAVFFGAALDEADAVDGGDGSLDQIGLQGDYSGGVTFGPDAVVNVEAVVLLPGSTTTFGAPGDELYSYDLTLVDANIDAGEELTFQANQLQAGEGFTLDASAELDGSVFTFGGLGADVITGSQQDDSFFFGTDRFTTDDKVDGQDGSFDSIGLQGDYSTGLTLADDQLSGIEILAVLSSSDSRFGGSDLDASYSYDLTLDDGNVASGESLVISANTLESDETLTFDGSAELDGFLFVFSGDGADVILGSAGDDFISGRGGADSLTGNAGDDTFLYSNLSDSTSGAEDQILDFTDGDLISLSSLDADDSTTADDAFAFIAEAAFSGTAGELRAENTSGSDWTIEADVDGDTVADFTLLLTTSDGDAITATDFVL